MLETHFPGSEVINKDGIAQRSSPWLFGQETRVLVLAGWVVSYDKVRWGISNFNAYKFLGKDNIFPALL
jgi:hypothetical protein